VDLFVLDDAVRDVPERNGMGPLCGVGGLHIPSAAVGALERALDGLCAEVGFSPGDEFKWSPGRELWMWRGLVDPARREFFLRALGLARDAGATALVVIADRNARSATGAKSPEEDVVTMFLERAHNALGATGTEAILLMDRPGGDRQEENEFLASCLTTMRQGTGYVLPARLTLAVSTQSRLVRRLQLADVVASSTLAFVAGEATYSPPVFEAIRPMLRRGGGGWGMKIHPDFRYATSTTGCWGIECSCGATDSWTCPPRAVPITHHPSSRSSPAGPAAGTARFAAWDSPITH
jgi:hypothetical protein